MSQTLLSFLFWWGRFASFLKCMTSNFVFTFLIWICAIWLYREAWLLVILWTTTLLSTAQEDLELEFVFSNTIVSSLVTILYSVDAEDLFLASNYTKRAHWGSVSLYLIANNVGLGRSFASKWQIFQLFACFSNLCYEFI